MVTLTPLLVMTLVDYRLTRQAFESEATMGSPAWSPTRGAAHPFCCPSAGQPWSSSPGTIAWPDLLAPGRLDAILANLQGGMGGFVDLGVVDTTCT
jgi:two-component system NtrC family sensor kinase